MTKPLEKRPKEVRRKRWKFCLSKEINKLEIELTKSLPAGHKLNWLAWRSSNRLKVGLGRSKNNLKKCGILQDNSSRCECGMEQHMEHLLNCQSCSSSCLKEDLLSANRNAITIARFWLLVIWKSTYQPILTITLL